MTKTSRDKELESLKQQVAQLKHDQEFYKKDLEHYKRQAIADATTIGALKDQLDIHKGYFNLLKDILPTAGRVRDFWKL